MGEPAAVMGDRITGQCHIHLIPNPPTGAHPIFSGAQHVWRTWAFGAGTPNKVPQDTTPDIAGYEANCPEFTAAFNTPTCGEKSYCKPNPRVSSVLSSETRSPETVVSVLILASPASP